MPQLTPDAKPWRVIKRRNKPFVIRLVYTLCLAVVLLLARPRYGLVLTVAIIVSDVAVNSWVGMEYGIDAAAFAAQVVFLLFVLFTVCRAWHAVER